MKQLSISRRPKLWSEVVGQYANVRILKNSIIMNRIPNVLLFSGMRGVGKTSMARLYAKSLNCVNFLNSSDGEPCNSCDFCNNINNVNDVSVLELDAASNNGVDDIRKLEDILNNKITSKYRVIILDECHMLSKSAQSALLKILEEMPQHVVFMLVTTNPESLNDTVRSRCLSIPLKAVSRNDIYNCIKNILDDEGIQCEDEVIDILSINSSGSVRDVQQMLERLLLLSDDDIITLDMVDEVVGIISVTQYQELAEIFIDKDFIRSFEQVKRWYDSGMDMKFIFNTAIPNLLRDFVVFLSGAYDGVAYISGIKHESFVKYIDFNIDYVNHINKEWEISVELMRNTDYPEVIWDMFLAKVFCYSV